MITVFTSIRLSACYILVLQEISNKHWLLAVSCYFQAINKEIRDLKARMQTLFDEKEQMQTENQDLTKRKAKLELTIKDVQDELEGNAKAKVSYTSWNMKCAVGK